MSATSDALATGAAALALAGAVLAVRLPGAHAYVAAAVAPTLVVLAVEDLRRRVIPNRIVLPATVAVLAGEVATSPHSAVWGLLAGLGAALLFAIPSLINGTLVGMGDAKLALLIGAAVGPRVIDALALGLTALLPVALATLLFGGTPARRASLPLGPFLALGTIVVLLIPAFR